MVHGLPDDLHGGGPVVHILGHGLLALQGLVDREEVLHLVKEVGGQIHQVVVGVVGGIGEGDGDDLLVVLAAVQHGDVADGVAAHQCEGVDFLRTEHQHVQRIAVVAVGAGNEAVVGGVVGGGVEHPVQDDKPGFLIQLVLLLAALGNLNDRHEVLGLEAAGADIMPDI